MFIIFLHGSHPVGVVHINPVVDLVVAGARSAATKHGADMKSLHLFWLYRHTLSLHHLADFLSQCHSAQ